MRPEQGRDGGGGGGEKVVEESEDTVALSATEFFFSLDFGGFDVVLAALGDPWSGRHVPPTIPFPEPTAT